MKIKIDGTTILRTLKGEPFKDEDQNDLTLGKLIAAILQTNTQGGKMKNFVLAQEFYKKDVVEIDIADFGIIKQALEITTQSNNIVIGQGLVVLDEMKALADQKGA